MRSSLRAPKPWCAKGGRCSCSGPSRELAIWDGLELYRRLELLASGPHSSHQSRAEGISCELALPRWDGRIQHLPVNPLA